MLSSVLNFAFFTFAAFAAVAVTYYAWVDNERPGARQVARSVAAACIAALPLCWLPALWRSEKRAWAAWARNRERRAACRPIDKLDLKRLLRIVSRVLYRLR